jgi:hypothetical protein
LTDAYENKVSALSSNPLVIAVEGGMRFDDLCLEIIEEEQRLTNKNGITTATIATAMTKTNTIQLTQSTAIIDQATLVLRLKELDKESWQLRAAIKCDRCGRIGHTDIIGEKGCFNNPANAEHKKRYWDERKGKE